MKFASQNLLLRAMESADFNALADRFVRVVLERDDILVEPHREIDHVYFLEDGIASIVSVSDGRVMTEVGIVGREGFVGMAAVLGKASSPHKVFMQVGSAAALRLALPVLQSAMEESPALRRLILRYVQVSYVQTAQSIVSHAHERLEARLARWLLMCHDRLDGDDVELTHSFMSLMVAAQRTGVTVALHVLEGGGMIRASRGHVRIIDRARLEEVAGPAYGVAEREYQRQIAPFSKLSPALTP